MVLKLAGSTSSGNEEENQHGNTSALMTDTITYTMVHVSTLKSYTYQVNNVTSYSRVQNGRSPQQKGFQKQNK